MTKLSVNVNKVALLRNSRGENLPNLLQVARDCEAFGAEGITVHPRPDQRHVRYDDVPRLKDIVTTEFNIEGNPIPEFMDLVIATRPTQCTLVPDDPSQLTSDAGWDTVRHRDFLSDVVDRLQDAGIRVSIFVDPQEEYIEGAKAAGADRIEFYTGHFARGFLHDPKRAIEPHARCARLANEIGIGINAGHDLNLDNLRFYAQNVENLLEVSIGHALISDSLYFGLQNTIAMYLQRLR